MAYRLVFTDSYVSRAKRFLRKHPEMLRQYEKTLQLLESNPYHKSLRLHDLQRQLSGLSSVAINISYRLMLESITEEDEIIPVDIATHDHL